MKTSARLAWRERLVACLHHSFGQPVARRAEIFVPHLRKRHDHVLHFSSGKGYPGMDDVSPGPDAGAFVPLLKGEPLPQSHADGMVDPAPLSPLGCSWL